MQRVQKKRVLARALLRAVMSAVVSIADGPHLPGSRGFALGTNEKLPALLSPTNPRRLCGIALGNGTGPVRGPSASKAGAAYACRCSGDSAQADPLRASHSVGLSGRVCHSPKPRHRNLWRGFVLSRSDGYIDLPV